MEDLKIESVIKAVAEYNKQAVKTTDERLEVFLKAFKAEFDKTTSETVQAETITGALFQPILSLYANGNNSSVIIEVHSILEKFSIRDFPKTISSDSKSTQIIADLLERKNLIDIAPYFVELEIWTSDDLIQIRQLVKLRNGIAHKSESLIAKSINSGKETHYLDIDSIVSNHDSKNYIILAIRLLLQLIDFQNKKLRTTKAITH